MPPIDDVAQSLRRIEAQLQDLGWWQDGAPDGRALASVEPFCVDTLSFVQWLQFVFLARMWGLLEAQQPLPILSSSSNIAAMAEQSFGSMGRADALIAELRALDQLLAAGYH